MKTLVRLVILLFIIGAILIGVAVSGGVNLEGITNYISDDESYGSEIVYLSTTTIDTLNMDLDTRNIEISVTTEDHIIVSYYEHEKDTWTISELNGILNIKQTVKATFFNWFNFKIPTYEVSTVYIEVPSDLILEYSLISSTGDIKYIEGPVKATDVFIDSATGNLNLQNLDMDSLVIRMDTGNISLDDLTILGGLDAESDTGNIIISDVNSEDTLLETETGKITLTNLVSSSLNADTATDNISLTDSLISGQVILSSNTGNVTITDSTGTSFDLSSDTGDMRFTSNQSIDLRYDLFTMTGNITVNGDNQGNMHSTSNGSILLKVKSTTGNITINVQD